jgi:ectoine hydroxylase-related dioxygenase (phytanoyl-CoA dioxygenase family)
MQGLNDYDYTEPFDLIDPIEIPHIIQEARKPHSSLKCIHKNSLCIQKLASHPSILSMVKELLGDTIYLWGSELILAKPGYKHRYHVDAEHFHIKGVTLSIALNVDEGNKFYFMSHSDSIPIAPQELSYSSMQELETIAKKYNEKASNVELTMKEGQCVIWKGRTWHSTISKSSKTRLSLILQYATCIPCIPNNYDSSKIPPSNRKFDGILINIPETNL